MKSGAIIILLVIALLLVAVLLYLLSGWLGVGKTKEKKQTENATTPKLPRAAAIAVVRKKTNALHARLPRRFTGLIILLTGGYHQASPRYVAAIRSWIRS